MVPEGQKMPASIPKILAAFSSNSFIDSSSPKTSSPTLALHIASNIPGVGLVTVSLRRSTIISLNLSANFNDFICFIATINFADTCYCYCMCKQLSILCLLFLSAVCVNAQKWQPGHFTDVKGNRMSGLIRVNPSGKAPIKDEGFIEFREDKKAEPFKLSASDLKSFVVGKDSFVVAHAPQTKWTL